MLGDSSTDLELIFQLGDVFLDDCDIVVMIFEFEFEFVSFRITIVTHGTNRIRYNLYFCSFAFMGTIFLGCQDQQDNPFATKIFHVFLQIPVNAQWKLCFNYEFINLI